MKLNTLSECIRLNLGCGTDVRSGYINFDRFPSHPDVRSAELPQIPWADSSADEVLLSHVLEHFGYAEAEILCREIYRVLRPGGIALIQVPDIQWCLAQFLGAPEPGAYGSPAYDYSTGHRWGLYAQSIWGDQHNSGLFHKWGYTSQRLCDLLSHVGFGPVEVRFVKSHGVQCLDAKAVRAG